MPAPIDGYEKMRVSASSARDSRRRSRTDSAPPNQSPWTYTTTAPKPRSLVTQLPDDGAIRARRHRFDGFAGRRPSVLHVFRRTQRDRHPLQQLQRKRVFQIARDAGRVFLTEGRQDVVHLGPLQISEQTLRDPGFFDDLAARRIVSHLAPFEASCDRLPKARRPPAFEQ